ncbi:S8 family peptidase [Senegalia massiliensis]|jgi:serine protease AprX|uniref:S8 family peptidase n=1 Tax=Senegalia massiliensis TaxID=1720316 RepID=UPI001F5F438C|nr:S8 family peptidase [Senegalia massiliensis]
MRRKRIEKIDPLVNAKLNSTSKEEIPIIIKYKKDKKEKISSMYKKIKYELPIVGSVACSMNLKDINDLKEDPDVEFISYDSKVFAQLDIVNKTIKTNIAIENDITGKDITIAVIDTGLAPHVDLFKPTNRILGFKDLVNNRTKLYDDNGHGTHVAGIIAGNGYASKQKFKGIAPLSNLVIVKALDSSGSGNTSDIVSAIQWVIDNKEEYDIKILNLSLGAPISDDGSSSPLREAVEEAVRNGITVVCAAGNSGPSKGSILCPGNSPSAITVGAIDDNKTAEINDDFIANFSSRGPTKEGLKKPDMVAPGVDIMSISNKNSSGYSSLSGTSMATPVITGACALLHEKHGYLKPRTVKQMLMSSCNNIGFSQNEQGAGIIDLEKLLNDNYNMNYNAAHHNNYNKHHKEYNYYDDKILIVILLVLILILDI